MLKKILLRNSGQDQTYLHHALRIAIATTIACIVYHIFYFNMMGYWVLVTTIITIQANLGASIKRAKDRLLGTILGVLIGNFCLLILPNHQLLILLLSPVLIFLTVFLYTVSYVYAIFFGSVLLILLLSQIGGLGWEYAVYRIVDTIIGLTIGLMASYLLWPKNAKVQLYVQLSHTVDMLREYFIELIACYKLQTPPRTLLETMLTAIENEMIVNRRLFQEFTYEPGSMRVRVEAVCSIVLNLEIIYDVLCAVRLALNENTVNLINDQQSIAPIEHFVDQLELLFKKIASAIAVQCKSAIDDEYFERFSIHYRETLLDPEEVRSILTSNDSQRYGLIFFTSSIKKLATALKNIAESVKQLNY